MFLHLFQKIQMWKFSNFELWIIFVFVKYNLFINKLNNEFQSIVYSPSFWITSCNLSGSVQIFLKKIHLISSLISFPQTFSPHRLEKILLFRRFCRKRKRWNSRDARFGEWGRTDQFKFNSFSWVILAECGFALSRSTTKRFLGGFSYFFSSGGRLWSETC